MSILDACDPNRASECPLCGGGRRSYDNPGVAKASVSLSPICVAAMERANAAVVPGIAGQHETVIMQSSPNVRVPDTPICNGILHWGEMLFCDCEPSLFRLYGGSKRLPICVVPPQVSGSFGEIVHFANLKRKFYDSRRAFAVVIDRQLEAHRMREKRGTSQPSAFAVLRLMTRSSLTACCTGKSAGFSPLRMRLV
jgi:hypothetical protein